MVLDDYKKTAEAYQQVFGGEEALNDKRGRKKEEAELSQKRK